MVMNAGLRFLLRLAGALAVLAAVAALALSLLEHVGDPVANLVGQEASAADRQALRAGLGLERPFPVRYADFLARAVAGDFGQSLRLGRPVAELIAERLPATLELTGVAALLAVGLGLPLGLLAALRPTSWATRLVLAVSLLGISLPSFLIGVALIGVFTVELGWLPSFGRGPVIEWAGLRSSLLHAPGWAHVLMPALTLAAFQAALILRLVRAELVEVLGSEAIRFARARGLPAWRWIGRHALRAAARPVLTVLVLQLGALLAFSVVTETVFQWPGLGLLFIQAVAAADQPLLAAYLCGCAALFLGLNLLVDLLAPWIDPRLRGPAAAEA